MLTAIVTAISNLRPAPPLGPSPSIQRIERELQDLPEKIDRARHQYSEACLALVDEQDGAADAVRQAEAERDRLDRRRDELQAALALARSREQVQADRAAHDAHVAAWQRAVADAETLNAAVAKFSRSMARMAADYNRVLVLVDELKKNLPRKLDPHHPWLHREELEGLLRREGVRHGLTWCNPKAALWGIHDLPELSAEEFVGLVRAWAAQETEAKAA